jgi:coenzyme PQQ precursor peptide PqqA
MKQPRQRWERPDFEERPLGAEVTAYVTAPGPEI